MSFCTHAEVFPLEFDIFDLTATSAKIDEMVRARAFHEDVATDFKTLLKEGRADFSLDSLSLIEMLAELAAFTPKMSFAARGLGEDPRMIWYREYEAGAETLSVGPLAGAEA